MKIIPGFDIGSVGDVGIALFGGAMPLAPSDTAGIYADIGPAGGDQRVRDRDLMQIATENFDVDDLLNSSSPLNLEMQVWNSSLIRIRKKKKRTLLQSFQAFEIVIPRGPSQEGSAPTPWIRREIREKSSFSSQFQELISLLPGQYH